MAKYSEDCGESFIALIRSNPIIINRPRSLNSDRDWRAIGPPIH